MLHALAVYAVMLLIVLAVGSIIVRYTRGLADLYGDENITVLQHGKRWGYHFEDPYGGLISQGGFHTELGARKAARYHRNKVARDLLRNMVEL